MSAVAAPRASAPLAPLSQNTGEPAAGASAAPVCFAGSSDPWDERSDDPQTDVRRAACRSVELARQIRRTHTDAAVLGSLPTDAARVAYMAACDIANAVGSLCSVSDNGTKTSCTLELYCERGHYGCLFPPGQGADRTGGRCFPVHDKGSKTWVKVFKVTAKVLAAVLASVASTGVALVGVMSAAVAAGTAICSEVSNLYKGHGSDIEAANAFIADVDKLRLALDASGFHKSFERCGSCWGCGMCCHSGQTPSSEFPTDWEEVGVTGCAFVPETEKQRVDDDPYRCGMPGCSTTKMCKKACCARCLKRSCGEHLKPGQVDGANAPVCDECRALPAIPMPARVKVTGAAVLLETYDPERREMPTLACTEVRLNELVGVSVLGRSVVFRSRIRVSEQLQYPALHKLDFLDADEETARSKIRDLLLAMRQRIAEASPLPSLQPPSLNFAVRNGRAAKEKAASKSRAMKRAAKGFVVAARNTRSRR